MFLLYLSVSILRPVDNLKQNPDHPVPFWQIHPINILRVIWEFHTKVATMLQIYYIETDCFSKWVHGILVLQNSSHSSNFCYVSIDNFILSSFSLCTSVFHLNLVVYIPATFSKVNPEFSIAFIPVKKRPICLYFM